LNANISDIEGEQLFAATNLPSIAKTLEENEKLEYKEKMNTLVETPAVSAKVNEVASALYHELFFSPLFKLLKALILKGCSPHIYTLNAIHLGEHFPDLVYQDRDKKIWKSFVPLTLVQHEQIIAQMKERFKNLRMEGKDKNLYINEMNKYAHSYSGIMLELPLFGSIAIVEFFMGCDVPFT